MRPVLFRPDWKHRELILRIGKGDYHFRTLSLYDVWSIWPHIVPIREAVERGKPLEFARRFSALLEHICPGLTTSSDFEKWTQVHLDALLEFYSMQDWARIQALAENLGSGEPPPDKKPDDDMSNESRFFLICMAAARATGMSVPEFVENRFEFCADAFMGLKKSLRADMDKSSGSAADFFRTAASILPADILSPDDERPDWIKDIEAQTGKGPGVQ
jgi:hypothetical protein